MEKIPELVRRMESEYINGVTQVSEYVSVSLKDDLDRIDAYLASKHISGEKDSLGRDKPFFNIVLAAENIWFRATDIDRKNIKIKATKQSDYILAFLASILLQEFMRKSTFGTFLNDWGLTLARYNSAVVKFVEKVGELYAKVIPWNRIICDSVNFYDNPKIEKLYFTPAQLRMNKSYDQELVDKLIKSKTTRKSLSRQQKDNKSEYIEVYEVHGELPLYCLTDKEKDTETYQQQMHVISFCESKGKGEYDDYTLYSGRESKDPYMLTSLFPNIDGSISLDGAVKNLFEAQWMMNHTVKTIKDQLDLASKLIFQTSDASFLGRNVLTNIEQGGIMIHAANQPLTGLNNNSHDVTSLQNFGNQWKSLGSEINGISESMLGLNPPSGTAWRQTQALLQESHSLFEIMTENKGLQVEEMMRNFIIPFLKKKMDTTEEISAILDAQQIKQIDSMYVPNQATRIRNESIKESVLGGEIPNPPDQMMLEQDIQNGLNKFGNQRFIKPSDIKTETWKDVMKDLEWSIEVEVTNESTDKQAVMDTLNTALQVVANPNYASNPDAKMIVGKILEETGVLSPLELSTQPIAPAVPSPLGGGQMGQVASGQTK